MKSCILCRESRVEPFLDLGRTALANKFLTKEELARPEPTFPLQVGFCHACGHIQLTTIVPPTAMFTDYLYVSAASDTLKAHLFDLSEVVAKRQGLGRTDLVVDVGCNDATLMQGFRRFGVRTLGVDPAENLARLAEGSGIERYVGFFGERTAADIAAKWGPASVITLTNTFPHIQDLPDFVRGVQRLLAPGGTLVMEMHYLVDLLEQTAFDTIYHEHVSYWALGPMQRLFREHGMEVMDAERLPLHHGQLRVFAQRQGESRPSAEVARLLEAERRTGIGELATYQAFARRTLALREDLRRTLRELASKGKRVAGYGAPAKGNTLLGFLELGPRDIAFIADRSPLKQGRFTPGTHIPVVHPQLLLDEQPDYVVLFAWNFADEVLAQQAEYRRRGGKFIVPVPEVRIL